MMIKQTKAYLFALFMLFLFTSNVMSQTELEHKSTISLKGDLAYPEGLAVHQKTKDIFVGNLVGKSIQVIRNDKNKAEYFVESGDLDLLNVIGMTVDSERNRLWVCMADFETMIKQEAMGNPEILVFDTKKGTLIKRFTNEGGGFFNDVALDRQGNAYITNSLTASVHKVDANLNSMKILIQDAGLNVVPNGFNLNGIDVTPDQRYLIASVPAGPQSKLYRIPIDGSEFTTVNIEGNFTGGDGIVFTDNENLIAISQGVNTLSFNESYSEATSTFDATHVQNGNLNFPTSVDIAGKTVYISNSQLDHWVPFFQPAREGVKPDLPFTISTFTLKK